MTSNPESIVRFLRILSAKEKNLEFTPVARHLLNHGIRPHPITFLDAPEARRVRVAGIGDLVETGEGFQVEVKLEAPSWTRHLPMVMDGEPLRRFLAGFQGEHFRTQAIINEAHLLFRPESTPFIDALASWVGVAFRPGTDDEEKRRLLPHLFRLGRIRGTAEGIRRTVELLTGVEVEILERELPHDMEEEKITEIDTTRAFTVLIRQRLGSTEAEEKKKLARIKEVVHREKPAFTVAYFDYVPERETPEGGTIITSGDQIPYEEYDYDESY